MILILIGPHLVVTKPLKSFTEAILSFKRISLIYFQNAYDMLSSATYSLEKMSFITKNKLYKKMLNNKGPRTNS